MRLSWVCKISQLVKSNSLQSQEKSENISFMEKSLECLCSSFNEETLSGSDITDAITVSMLTSSLVVQDELLPWTLLAVVTLKT